MQPHRIKVGASVVLISLDGLAADWGISVGAARRLCGRFGLKTLTPEPDGKQYVNLYPLESALFEALLPEAFSGDHELVKAHQELAGVLYGHVTAKLIRERVLAIARGLRKGPPSRKGKRPVKRT
jgi:hypothetical protein